MTLADPRTSRALLVGIDTYTRMPALPSAAAGTARLAELLCDPTVWVLPRENVSVLGAEASRDRILRAAADAADATTGTLLVYFAGHGLRDREGERLYLALRDADEDRPEIGTVPYLDLRRVVRRAGQRVRHRITVLDCCYSGLAGAMGGTGTQEIPRSDLARAVDESPRATWGDSHDDGESESCLLTYAPPNRPSFAPPGMAYPQFTGQLIEVMERGIPGAGPILNVDHAWNEVRRRLRERGGAQPQQFGHNSATRRDWVRNRALRPRPRPWRFRTDHRPNSSAKVADGTVFFAALVGDGEDQMLYALHAATGAERWNRRVACPTALLFPPTLTVADGTVYVDLHFSEGDGRIDAVDAATGTLRWRHHGGLGWPVAAGGMVYVTEADEHDADAPDVVALDAATGAERWRCPRGVSATVADGTVYTCPDNQLRALDPATGTPRWSHAFGLYPPAHSAVAGGTIYVTIRQQAYALDTATGALRWVRHFGGWLRGEPVVVGGTVYVAAGIGDAYSVTGEGNLFALDAADGTPRWVQPFELGVLVPAVKGVTGGTAYVRGRGLVRALDVADGTSRWTYSTGEWSPSLVVTADTVYASHWDPSDGQEHVHALDPATGTHHWTHPIEPGFPLAVIAGELVYFVSSDGIFTVASGTHGRPTSPESDGSTA